MFISALSFNVQILEKKSAFFHALKSFVCPRFFSGTCCITP